MANQRHTMKVTDGKETLILTFSNSKVAWDAYRSMPKSLNTYLPEREMNACYSNASDAVETASNFFHLGEQS